MQSLRRRGGQGMRQLELSIRHSNRRTCNCPLKSTPIEAFGRADRPRLRPPVGTTFATLSIEPNREESYTSRQRKSAMDYTDPRSHLHIQIEAKQCQIAPELLARM